jgi:hypothetical protein
MKTFEFYQNAETLIFTEDFNSLKEADEYCKEYCKENSLKYWNMEVRRKSN